MGRNNKDFSAGTTPDMSDVRKAYFSGKVTMEEANDLTGTNDFSPKSHPDNTRSYIPTDFELEHNAYYTHKRAGLN